jgi:hypothetical protein
MHRLFAVLSLIFLVPTALRADDDNPFKKANVGDWVEYKMTGTIQGTTKMTIVAKTDKEVTFEVTGTYSFMGRESAVPALIQKIDLTKSYDPIVAANLKRTGTKIEKEAEGAEKIKVGAGEFDTKWTKLKSTTTVQGITVVSEHKMWYAKEVPLTGLVRMDTTTGTVTTQMELIGSGSK